MRIILALAAIGGLVECSGDETVTSYGGAASDWLLIEIDGKPFGARATLNLAAAGKISGQAPCNQYFGEQTAPYPWFSAEKIGATRRACPELDQETRFLSALSEMTLSEVAGDTLILSNEAGSQMVFRAITAQPE